MAPKLYYTETFGRNALKTVYNHTFLFANQGNDLDVRDETEISDQNTRLSLRTGKTAFFASDI